MRRDHRDGRELGRQLVRQRDRARHELVGCTLLDHRRIAVLTGAAGRRDVGCSLGEQPIRGLEERPGQPVADGEIGTARVRGAPEVRERDVPVGGGVRAGGLREVTEDRHRAAQGPAGDHAQRHW